MNDHAKGLLITTLGVLFVVPDSLFIRLIDADGLTIAFWRQLSVGVCVALGLLIWQGIAPFRAVLGTGWAGVVYVLGLGFSGVFFVQAIDHTSVANVVFILASLPVFAMIYSRVFLAEPITRRMIFTILAVMVGLAIILAGSSETEGATWQGDLMALIASALFAACLTGARAVKHVSMVAGVPIAYIGVALLIMPFAAPLEVDPAQLPLFASHTAFIVLSSVFLALGPRYIPSAEVSLLVLIETIAAPLLAWYVLSEYPGNYTLAGGVVVLGALVISNLIVLRRKRS